jgi:polyketide synthase 13
VLSAGTGDTPPLLLFHPGGGDCEVYRPLLAGLPEHLACYGFDRVRGGDVAERVAEYLPRLREVQPHGPYRLAGWSFGGALAYAAACLLVEAGEPVELVALLDTMLPLPDETPDPRVSSARRFARFARHVERTYGVSVPLEAAELAVLPEEEQVEDAMARVAAAGPDLAPAVLRHHHDSFLDTLAAELQ